MILKVRNAAYFNCNIVHKDKTSLGTNYITHISLRHFRNIKEERADFGPGINIITGLNGAGKSSLIDAVHCLAFGRSYFASSDKYLIGENQEFYRIQGSFKQEENAIEVANSYAFNRKKTISVDSKKHRRLSDHIGKIPIVCIAPGDVSMIEGASEHRRKFVDRTLGQFDKAYVDALGNYNRLLKQRNSYLKKDGTPDENYLQILDQQMTAPADHVYQSRKSLIAGIQQSFLDIYDQISGHAEAPAIKYQSHIAEDSFISHAITVRQRDLITGRTNRGIHKDDLLFLLNDMVLKQVGSQGQIKSYLFSLKLTQFEKLAEETGKIPILLLDDIFDKLDDDRVLNILQLIQNRWKGQVLITDTSISRLRNIIKELNTPIHQLHIEKGCIKHH